MPSIAGGVVVVAAASTSTVGLTLASVSTVGNSVLDLLKKKLLDNGANKTHMLTIIEFVNLLAVVPLMLWVGDVTPLHVVPQRDLAYAVGGVLAGGAGKWFHAVAISLGGVATTVPFITLSPVVSVLIAMQINDEFPASLGIFGVLMICTGAASLALSRTNAPPAPDVGPASPKLKEDDDEVLVPELTLGNKENSEKEKPSSPHGDTGKAIAAMLVCAVLWAISACLVKMALKEIPFVELTAISNSIMLVVYCLLSIRAWSLENNAEMKKAADNKETTGEMVPLVKGTSDDGEVVVTGRDTEDLTHRLVGDDASDSDIAEVRPRRMRTFAKVGKQMCWPVIFVHQAMHGNAHWYCIVGVVEVITICLYFLAMRYLYVSYVLALKRGGSVVISVAGGAFFFKEPVSRKEQLCIALMSLGVCFVVLS